jgi:hypothetical protein
MISWKDAPAYELKHLMQTWRNYVHLLYTYNIRNPIHLITDIQTLEIKKDMIICSFDIENLYANIPK